LPEGGSSGYRLFRNHSATPSSGSAIISNDRVECGAVMSSPTNSDKDDFIRALAKQAYRHELLVKTLRARGYLGPGEPESLETAEEFDRFLKIFRLYFSGKDRRPSESGES
jgi:hypothetical protein